MQRARDLKLRRSIGEALRAARLARGVRVRELAERVDLDISTIYRIERCRDLPSLTALLRLADALGLDVDVQLRAVGC